MPEMSVDLFFGVPVLVHDIDPAVREAIATKVEAYLNSDLARRDLRPADEESVTTTYYRPEQSIVADAGIKELELEVLSAATTFLEKRLGIAPRPLEIERAWINLFEPGAQEAQHTHDGSLLSCSYYVEAPENCGCIVFPDPIGERRGYRHFTHTVGKNMMTRGEIAIEPKAGRLVMFESWFSHSVQCNKSDKRRISIAFNLREARPKEADRALAADASSRPAERAKPRPYLFNDVFAAHKNLHLSLNPILDTIPTAVVDNVLQHPDQVRDIVGSMPAANWKHEAGGRNFVDYYDCRLRIPVRYPTSIVSVAQKVIQQVYRLDTRPVDASVDVNWFMQVNPRRANFAVPHSDRTEAAQRSLTCVLYLNSREESSGGTGFFRFRPSNSLVFDEPYARAMQANPRIGETGFDYWPERADEHWELVGSVDMVPGRMLIFPSEYFHAAYHPKDSFTEFPRLTLAFWMIGLGP